MNFFEHQDQANKSTRQLVLLFLAAVLVLIALTDFLVVIIYSTLSTESHQSLFDLPLMIHVVVSSVVAAVVFVACMHKFIQLRLGGYAVANALGATLLAQSTDGHRERQLLNVVEEMAIASGVPVPPVFVVEDSAINAFAAGFSQHDAIIGVTRGLIDLLNRDEMQGVIAHEFSHILNGDMRLNLKLIGILHGILFIALAGQRILYHGGRSRSGAQLGMLGFGLMIIGYGGVFFGNLIKAAVSRQREFLADASAVQFTRNPDGIAGALKKIGGWSVGSQLAVQRAAEYSHFYIAEGVASYAFSMFKTHPKLEERIVRIQPSWDGNFPKVTRSPDAAFTAGQKAREQKVQLNIEPVAMVTTAMLARAIANTGAPTSDHVGYAHTLMSKIPENLMSAAHKPVSAYALVLGLLIGKDINQWKKKVAGIDQQMGSDVKPLLEQFMPDLASMDLKYRLPLIELALPAIRAMEKQQQDLLKKDLLAVIKSDGRVELWEWALFRIVKLSLGKPEIPKAKYGHFKPLADECCMVLAAVVYSGDEDPGLVKSAFAAAVNVLEISVDLPEKGALNGFALSQALKKIKQLKPLIKPKFLKALALAVQHDGVIETEEMEVVRAIAESIDCPMPPILN